MTAPAGDGRRRGSKEQASPRHLRQELFTFGHLGLEGVYLPGLHLLHGLGLGSLARGLGQLGLATLFWLATAAAVLSLGRVWKPPTPIGSVTVPR